MIVLFAQTFPHFAKNVWNLHLRARSLHGDVIFRIPMEVLLLIEEFPIFLWGASFGQFELAGEVLDVVNAHLGCYIAYGVGGGLQQLGKALHAQGGDVLVDGLTRSLAETYLQQSARQGYQCHQVVHVQGFAEVAVDVVQYREDVRVGSWVVVGGEAVDDIHRLDDDVLWICLLLIIKALYQGSRFLATLFDVLADAGEGRVADVADNFVVIYA